MENRKKKSISWLLLLGIVSVLIVSIVGLVGCGEDKKSTTPTTPSQDENVATDILTEDGTYKIDGLQSMVKMHPENFGDVILVEKKDGTYYVTVEILNNTKVERLYWDGRRDSMNSDALITKDGLTTRYMFAFTDSTVRGNMNFHIGGGKMPFDPSLSFKLDFDRAVKVSDEVAEITRPVPFI